MKLSKHHYNYRLTVGLKDGDRFITKTDKLYSQLRDIQQDLPHLSLTELKYLSAHDGTIRMLKKYRHVWITKINPIPIY
jgi:hypothetical protein